MSFEFECECRCLTIFKEIAGLTRRDLICASCSKPLSLTKHLVRFDKMDKTHKGVLVSGIHDIDDRINNLTDKIADLTDRFDRLEMLILDDRTEADLDN